MALPKQASLPAAEAETHVDLAEAYRRMGLIGDALGEAAAALDDEKNLARPAALKALTILLDQRHLTASLDELAIALREKLFVN